MFGCAEGSRQRSDTIGAMKSMLAAILEANRLPAGRRVPHADRAIAVLVGNEIAIEPARAEPALRRQQMLERAGLGVGDVQRRRGVLRARIDRRRERDTRTAGRYG